MEIQGVYNWILFFLKLIRNFLRYFFRFCLNEELVVKVTLVIFSDFLILVSIDRARQAEFNGTKISR